MLEPTESQVAKLMSLPSDAPVGALNLLKFKDIAQYQSSLRYI